jgi:hypothetical protein
MLGAIGFIAAKMQSAGISSSILQLTGDLLVAISKSMLLMVPVIAAAGVLGAMLMGPQGLIVGAAISIGLATIGASVAGLAGLALNVIKTINTMPIEPGLDKKTKAFTDVLGSINAMIDSIGKILKELSPGLTDFISVMFGGKITDRLEQSRQFINSLLPSVHSLVNVAKDSITMISSGGERMIKAASIFSSVLDSIGIFVKALVPPHELIEGSTEEYGFFSTKIVKTTSDAGAYVKTVSTSVTGFISLISSFISKVSSMQISKDMLEKGIPTLGNMLNAVGSIMNALTPSPEALKNFRSLESKESETGLFSGTIKKTIEKIDTKGLSQFLEHTTTNFNTLLKTLTSGQFKQFLIDAADVVKNPQQLKSLEAIGGIMSSIGSVIKSISDAGRLPEIKSISGTNINVSLKTTDINKVLLDLSGESSGIKQMFDMIATLSTTFASVKDSKQRFSTLNDIFTSLTSISTFTKTMLESMQALSQGENALPISDVDKMMMPMKTLGTLLNRLAQPGEGSLNDISTQLLTLTGDSSIMNNLKVASQNGVQLGTYVQSIKTNVIEKGIVPALDAVQQMVSSLNDMNDAMSKIELGKQTVQVGLRKVASEMGVGGKASYTINNKPINIHLEIGVEMKASELERTLVFRKDSIIRDQLRWIRRSEQGREAFQNDEFPKTPTDTYTQHVPG